MSRFTRRWKCKECGRKYKTRRTRCKFCGAEEFEDPHIRS